MSKVLNDKLRAKFVEMVKALMTEAGEDVLQVGSNELAIPCVDEAGEDQYVVLTVKVPTGSRDGDAYDAYALAEDYQMKCEEKAVKAKEAAEKKAKKIARDAQMREAKAAAKAAAEAAKQ